MNLHPSHSMQRESLKSQKVQRRRSLMPTGMEEEADKKRCVPISRWTEARSMAVGTWQMNYSMAMVIQWTGIRPMAVGIWCLGDNPDTKIVHSYQRKMTKTQRTRIRPMVESIQWMNFGSRAKASCSHPQGLRKALHMSKSLKTAST